MQMTLTTAYLEVYEMIADFWIMVFWVATPYRRNLPTFRRIMLPPASELKIVAWEIGWVIGTAVKTLVTLRLTVVQSARLSVIPCSGL